MQILGADSCDRVRSWLAGNKAAVGAGDVKRGAVITKSNLSNLSKEQLFKVRIADEAVNERIEKLEQRLDALKSGQTQELKKYKNKLTNAPICRKVFLRRLKYMWPLSVT